MKMTEYERENMFSMLEAMIQMLEKAETLEEHSMRYGRVSGAIFILYSQDIITDKERTELECKTDNASLKALRKPNFYF